MQAYLGIGSNLGEPVINIKRALDLINSHEQIRVISVSSLYLTEPVGFEAQPWFYNCVAGIETELTPQALLEALQKVENMLGRVRDIRWGPRTIDIDILLYAQIKMDEEFLTIPHPRMTERAFVMAPLNEIAGNVRLPDGRTVREVRNLLSDPKKCRCITENLW